MNEWAVELERADRALMLASSGPLWAWMSVPERLEAVLFELDLLGVVEGVTARADGTGGCYASEWTYPDEKDPR